MGRRKKLVNRETYADDTDKDRNILRALNLKLTAEEVNDLHLSDADRLILTIFKEHEFVDRYMVAKHAKLDDKRAAEQLLKLYRMGYLGRFRPPNGNDTMNEVLDSKYLYGLLIKI